MSKLTDSELAVSMVRHLLESKGVKMEGATRLPLEFSEFSDFAIVGERVAPDITWSWHYWDLLYSLGVIEDIHGNTYVSSRMMKKCSRIYDSSMNRKMELMSPGTQLTTDPKEMASKSELIMGLITRSGKGGISFNRLLRLGAESDISRDELKFILASLKSKSIIRCEDGMYIVI